MARTEGIGGCWAGPLGNCGGGISREHYVSQCVFPDQSIFVQGLDWCLNEPKEVRIESLTAKILCRNHNSALSELDSEAGRAFSVIRDSVAGRMRNRDYVAGNWTLVAGRELTRTITLLRVDVDCNQKSCVPVARSCG
jgi:hypothetical protein